MNIKNTDSNANQQRNPGKKSWIENLFQVGSLLWDTDMTSAPCVIWKQLLLLNREGCFIADESRSVEMLRQIFVAFPNKFSPNDKRVTIQATVLSDIGKSGSAGMSKDGKRLILRMYRVENVPDGHKMTVDNFLANKGPYSRYYDLTVEELERDRKLFLSDNRIWGVFPDAESDIGGGWEICAEGQREIIYSRPFLDNIPMVDFWSLGHVRWMQNTLKEETFGEEVYIAASLHHLLDGVAFPSWFAYPLRIKVEDFSSREALVAIVDKYDAFRVRTKLTHEKTISILHSMVDQRVEKIPKLSQEDKRHIKEVYTEAIEMVGNVFGGTQTHD